MQKTKVTIITVVLNDKDALEKTLRSILSQHFKNIELIVIDGGSADGTLEFIKKNASAIKYWISEPDNGIYDAMNKGIDLSSGDWINFMNAGDTFYNNEVLTNIFNNKLSENTVLYGDVQVVYPNKTKIAKAGNINNFWQGSKFSHQSAFTLASFHKAHKFNTENKIGADFEFFYKAFKNDLKFKYLNLVASSITSGGISDTKRIDSIVSHWNSVEKNTKTNVYYIWIILKEMAKNTLKKLL